MASSRPAHLPATAPLSFMQKLSANVYLHRGPDSSSAPTSEPEPVVAPPRAILFLSWMGAQEAHIAKYLVRYIVLYPSAHVILVKCDVRHFLQPGVAYRGTCAAVPALRTALDADGAAQAQSPGLLVHLLSNGGSNMLWHLYRAWRREAGEEALPPHVTVFDSSPGLFTFGRGVNAFMAGAARISCVVRLLVVRPVVYFMMAFGWLYTHLVASVVRSLSGRELDVLRIAARAHNERPGANGKELRRVYFFSMEDDMINWRDVEAHAEEALGNGFVVRRERFVGSRHVSHVRVDEERYWRLVVEAWEGKGGRWEVR